MRLGPPEIPEKGRALLGFFTHTPPTPASITKERAMWIPLRCLF